MVGLHALLTVLGPDPLRVDELGFPGDDVTEDVRDKSLLVVVHTSAVVSDTSVGLLAPALVTSGNEDVRA